MEIKPLRFIGEPIQAQFDQPPILEKKPGCPDQFVWHGKTYRIVEKSNEWHDYTRRGRMARNMRPEHAAVAWRRGSWGVGRDYYGVRGIIREIALSAVPLEGDVREQCRKGSFNVFVRFGKERLEMAEQLAILGGSKAITVDTSEQWKRPVEEEKAAVCKLIDEGFLSGSGRGVPKEFEDRFREYIGCKYVLTTSHGHTALASAFFAAGLGAGDEFIAPTIGYIGSYAGALHMGAKPVFCEVDPKTLLMDPADAEKRITRKTRVLAPIHSCGRVCDMDALLTLAEKYDLVVVEDAAHAHGSEWGGVKIGNLGHIACFSMQGTTPGGKPVAAGEAGIVVTNDSELYERALIYCHLHRPGALDELTNPIYKQLEPQLLGWKWRAHPLAVAIGLVSLKTLPYRLEHFAANREELFEKIEGLPGIRPVSNYPKAKGVELYGGIRFLYDLEALSGLPAARFVEAMRAEGASIGGPRIGHVEHLRAIYTKDLPGLWGKGHPGPANIPLPRYKEGDFPISEGMRDKVLSYPGHIEAAEGFIDQFATAFKKVVDQHKKLL